MSAYGLTEVDLMEGDWDGVILRQYNRFVLSLRLKGFSDEISGIPRRLRLSTEHYWENLGILLKRKVVYLFWEKGTGKA